MTGFDLANQIVARVARPQRNCLHETQHREAMCWRVVRGQQAISHFGIEPAVFGANARCDSTKGVATQDQPGAQTRVAAQPECPREALALGQMERRGVQHDQPANALPVPNGVTHADHAAPVVQH